MANTTNYNWETPDDTDLVKDGALAIRTLGSSIDTTTKALNPSTTLGDIEYRSSTANTNTRLAIGSTGNVLTVSGGVPVWAAPAGGSFVGCMIYMSSNTNIPADTQTTVNFDSELFDTNSFHDNTTNNSRITIPSGKAGKYLITASFLRQTSGVYSIMGINKNGTRISVVSSTDSGGTQHGFSLSRVEDLSVGDYLQIYVQFGGTLDLYSGSGATTLSVVYLGA